VDQEAYLVIAGWAINASKNGLDALQMMLIASTLININ